MQQVLIECQNSGVRLCQDQNLSNGWYESITSQDTGRRWDKRIQRFWYHQIRQTQQHILPQNFSELILYPSDIFLDINLKIWGSHVGQSPVQIFLLFPQPLQSWGTQSQQLYSSKYSSPNFSNVFHCNPFCLLLSAVLCGALYFPSPGEDANFCHYIA